MYKSNKKQLRTTSTTSHHYVEDTDEGKCRTWRIWWFGQPGSISIEMVNTQFNVESESLNLEIDIGARRVASAHDTNRYARQSWTGEVEYHSKRRP